MTTLALKYVFFAFQISAMIRSSENLPLTITFSRSVRSAAPVPSGSWMRITSGVSRSGWTMKLDKTSTR